MNRQFNLTELALANFSLELRLLNKQNVLRLQCVYIGIWGM